MLWSGRDAFPDAGRLYRDKRQGAQPWRWHRSGSGSASAAPSPGPTHPPTRGGRRGPGTRRYFTRPDVHPYEEVTWERRDARITNYRDGSVAFEQTDVEVP